MANRKYCYEKVIHVVMISFAVVFGLLVFFLGIFLLCGDKIDAISALNVVVSINMEVQINKKECAIK